MKTAAKTNNIEEITEKLEQGVKEVFDSEKYRAYLEFVSKFYDYSVNNTILIWMQKPDASLVAGYKAWQTKFNRQVKKGEKGIKILAPCPHKFKKKEKDETGNEVEKEIQYTTFRAISVFDISQTEGEDVPRVVEDLQGNVEQYADLVEKLKALSPVPVDFEAFDSKAKGYYSPSEQRVVVQPDLSELQSLKTLIHEISHAILHNDEDGEQKDADRHTKEVQAESVAYTVCAALGLDTSEYSFGYVAGWSAGREVKELTASMDVIRRTAKEIIEALKTA
jgi:antirestriction protein ArdC